MKFSPQQSKALKTIHEWVNNPHGKQYFYLAGYAGTGKTTLAKYFAEGVKNGVLYATFTGKAAYVLRSKGCRDASTIHSLIYLPREKSKERLTKLTQELSETLEDDPDVLKLKEEIKLEKENLARPSFNLNMDSSLRGAGLLIVDEVSMVNEKMALDLLSFNTKILVLGDPAQLPPVFGTGYFINDEPDIMLTDIHRQAKDSPIIHIATLIRNQKMPTLGEYGESVVTNKITADMVQEADQLLVGKNTTRKSSNKRYREILGYSPMVPMSGDKLVCLRNENELGLLNGAIWNVIEIDEMCEDAISMTIGSDDDQVVGVYAHMHHFQDRELSPWERKERSEFDFSYALTVHKSQGSQFDHVLLFDESSIFRGDKYRWLYTGVTRAAEKLVLVNRSL